MNANTIVGNNTNGTNVTIVDVTSSKDGSKVSATPAASEAKAIPSQMRGSRRTGALRCTPGAMNGCCVHGSDPPPDL